MSFLVSKFTERRTKPRWPPTWNFTNAQLIGFTSMLKTWSSLMNVICLFAVTTVLRRPYRSRQYLAMLEISSFRFLSTTWSVWALMHFSTSWDSLLLTMTREFSSLQMFEIRDKRNRSSALSIIFGAFTIWICDVSVCYSVWCFVKWAIGLACFVSGWLL